MESMPWMIPTLQEARGTLDPCDDFQTLTTMKVFRKCCTKRACCLRTHRIFKLLCVVQCVVGTILYLVIFNDDSNVQNHSVELCNSEQPYATTFDNITFSNHSEKTVAIWTTFFRSHSWLHNINWAFSSCTHKCRAVNKKGAPDSDALLFHYRRYDLDLHQLPRRNPNQIWIIYLMEATIYIERNLSELNNIFNWTMSYRRDSTVFAPYGSFVKRRSDLKLNPILNRTKFAFAVFSHCSDIGKRYRIVKELQKYINIDIYGSCGRFKCDTKSQGCLSTEKAQDYLFKLSFENSHCKDYVTEKLWFPLKQGVIPVVNWVKGQEETRVNSSHVINMYDFRTIKELADYLKLVAGNQSLYSSYLTWRNELDVETSHFHSFCNLCKKLHQSTARRQVYSDFSGWLTNDICPKYKFVQKIRSWIDRWILFQIGL